MKWVVVVMFLLWVIVMWGALAQKEWSQDGEVTIVKMGAKP